MTCFLIGYRTSWWSVASERLPITQTSLHFFPEIWTQSFGVEWHLYAQTHLPQCITSIITIHTGIYYLFKKKKNGKNRGGKSTQVVGSSKGFQMINSKMVWKGTRPHKWANVRADGAEFTAGSFCGGNFSYNAHNFLPTFPQALITSLTIQSKNIHTQIFKNIANMYYLSAIASSSSSSSQIKDIFKTMTISLS